MRPLKQLFITEAERVASERAPRWWPLGQKRVNHTNCCHTTWQCNTNMWSGHANTHTNIHSSSWLTWAPSWLSCDVVLPLRTKTGPTRQFRPRPNSLLFFLLRVFLPLPPDAIAAAVVGMGVAAAFRVAVTSAICTDTCESSEWRRDSTDTLTNKCDIFFHMDMVGNTKCTVLYFKNRIM